MSTEQVKSVTDCHFYSLGSCTKGANCEFRHVHNSAAAVPICPQWREESCFDVACEKRHPTLPRNKTDGSLIPCAYRIRCANPENCPYAHEIPSIAPLGDKRSYTLSEPASEPKITRPRPKEAAIPSSTSAPHTSPAAQPSSARPSVMARLERKRPLPKQQLTERIQRTITTESEQDQQSPSASFVKSLDTLLSETKHKTPVENGREITRAVRTEEPAVSQAKRKRPEPVRPKVSEAKPRSPPTTGLNFGIKPLAELVTKPVQEQPAPKRQRIDPAPIAAPPQTTSQEAVEEEEYWEEDGEHYDEQVQDVPEVAIELNLFD